MSGYIQLQRVSSFETLANGYAGKNSSKLTTIRGRTRGHRRESVGTPAAQEVLDEVFRSSIRGKQNMNRNLAYGTVRAPVVHPYTTEWVESMSIPKIPKRYGMYRSTSETSQRKKKNYKKIRNAEGQCQRTRKVSLSPTVIEYDESGTPHVSREQLLSDIEAEDIYEGYEDGRLNGIFEEGATQREESPELDVRQHDRMPKLKTRRTGQASHKRFAGLEGTVGEQERHTTDEGEHNSGKLPPKFDRSGSGLMISRGLTLAEKFSALEQLVEDIKQDLERNNEAITR
jgi:hypothetical protein